MFLALPFRRWEITRSRRSDLFGSLVAVGRCFGWLPGDHAGQLVAGQLSGTDLSHYRKFRFQGLKALKRTPTPGQVSVDVRINTDPAAGRPTEFIIGNFIDSEFLERALAQWGVYE